MENFYGYNIAIMTEGKMKKMAQTVIRAIVEPELKSKAQVELSKMGLTISDLIRMALREAAEGHVSFSFDGIVRNKDTIEAMKELDEGAGESAKTLAEFHAAMRRTEC